MNVTKSTVKAALAVSAAALLAMTAPVSSDQSEFVEVAMTVEFGGDSISPVVLLKAGRTADIQFSYDPDYGRPEGPRKAYEEAPAEYDPRRDHRLLLAVESTGDSGYLAKIEYMSRPDGKWISQWFPTMSLGPNSDASFELEAEEGELSRLTLAVLPRGDIGSFEDAKLSYFHSTGQNCHTVVESVSAPSSSGSSGQASAQSQNPGPAHLFAMSASDCCTIKCGPFRMRCCNACCSDSANCPGVSCCAGRHPGIAPTFPGAP